MRIESINFRHHKILGTTDINLYYNADIDRSQKEQIHDDMSISTFNTINNTYTYIIGDNGVGKTVLFKSVIDYCNTFVNEDNPNIKELYSIIKDNKYAIFHDRAFNELFYRYDIWNVFNCKDFLKNNNAYLVYLSSAINDFEDAFYGISNRYYKINYSDDNQLKIMFLKAFRYLENENFATLSKYLEKKDSQWNIDIMLSYFSWSKDQKIISVRNGITIFSVIGFFNELESVQYKFEELGEQASIFLDCLLSTKSIKEYISTYDVNIKQLLTELKLSDIFKSLVEFISKFKASGTIGNRLTSKAIGICLNSSEDISPIIDKSLDIKAISEIDFLFIIILQELNLIDSEIECDDIPIENMSSGEQMLIRVFSLFASLPQNFEMKNLIVLLDEPENSLHPKWQQLFPEYFKSVVENVYGIHSSHFIFATHSPLIIMKTALLRGNSNVIKLYKDENGITKSMQIKDVHSYSIEELLMDEFSLKYRSNQLEQRIKNILDQEAQRRNSDSSCCILDYENFRNEVDMLYQEVIRNKK